MELRGLQCGAKDGCGISLLLTSCGSQGGAQVLQAVATSAVVQAATARKVLMKGMLSAFLRTARDQVFGTQRRRIWTAYTRTGKVVVIEGDKVVKVIDPSKQKGGYAR